MLTVEELKALKWNDWVWVVYLEYPEYNEYTRKKSYSDDDLFSITPANSAFLTYSNYGKNWIAYKNKEQAEGKEDEIRKDVAKEILQDLKGLLEGYVDKRINETLFTSKCKQYGVEVNE